MDPVAPSRNLELQLLRELNAGTFARLYVAQARGGGGLERLVAVKLLREQWAESTEIVDRTRDEARLLARLRHKNIVRVEELAEIEGQPAIIMEFVDGLDLKQLVEVLQTRGERLPPRVALQVVLETASALEAAWSKAPYGTDKPLQVVHRDIKPSNVMVSVEGELKVLDFGTARSSQAFRAAQTGALRFGSLKYMSPERREGDRGEHPGDTYALGLMAAELLQNAWEPLLPLEATEHDEAVLQWIGRLPDTGMPNRDWDLALRKVLVQMLAADPSIRPGADQVVKLMRAFVDQAMGPTLEAFAADKVLPLTRELRLPITAGTLAGTRVTVQIRGEPERVAPPPSSHDAPAAPKLIVRSKADSNTHPPPDTRDPRPSEPPPAPSLSRLRASEEPPRSGARKPAIPAGPGPSVSPPGPPVRALSPEPPRPRNTGGIPLRVGGQTPRTDTDATPLAPIPPPAPPPRLPPRPDTPGDETNVRPLVVPRVEPPPRPTPAPAPKPARSPYGLIAALVVALGLGAGVIGVALVVVAVVLYPSSTSVNPGGTGGTASSGTTGSGSTGSGSTEPGSTGGPSVSVSVAVTGMDAQWFKVEDAAGKVVAQGKDKLSASVPQGSYTLAIKPVGRAAVRGALTVNGEPVALTCARDKEGATCTGGKTVIPLK